MPRQRDLNKLRSLLCILLACSVWCVQGVGVADAQTHYVLSYFETQVPGACTAGSPNTRGSYHRIYKDSQTCSGLPRYHLVKGAGRQTWSTESFVIRDGFLNTMNEIIYNTSTGNMTQYRAFRDMTLQPPSKGKRTLITSFTGLSKSWGTPYYVEEYWTDSTGQPVCFNTQQNSVDGTVNWGMVEYLGTFSNWLKDEVIRRTDQWGANHYEYYYYGRWTNPATGQKQGIGPIKWAHYQGSTLINSNEKHFLVDCNAVATCSTCPP
jgi:hypothetical protein